MNRKVLHKKNGAIDSVLYCTLVIIVLIAMTLISLKLRVAKNIKFEMEDAVVSAATAAEVTDLFLLADTGEMALDCTGDGMSNGLYEDKLNATYNACQFAYGRFQDHLETTMRMEPGFVTTGDSGYLKKVTVKEFTVYNVLDDMIYCSTYNGTTFEAARSHPHHTVTVNARDVDIEIRFTSIYVSLEATVEIFGDEYVLPFTEYVYIND